ncbi:transposase [Patescibacteria group bacterium]|nr:transposase [Patescibacteria group bacterium]
MASPRPIAFRNSYVYHVFNRGVERRNIFLSARDYRRFTLLIEYYRFMDVPRSFSHFLTLPVNERQYYAAKLRTTPPGVDILAYCLMPNHFHLIVRQNVDHGIITAISTIANGYAKYFNKKQDRVGPLYQGPFKAVPIETDEQLLHVSRYIHLNPVSSGIIDEADLWTYRWSSLPAYGGTPPVPWLETRTVLSHFSDKHPYRDFVSDQIALAKQLEKIKHLVLEEV